MVAAAALAPSNTTTAQQQWGCLPETCPELWVRVQDSALFYRIKGNGDTIPADRFSAGFILLMTADSTGIVDFTFTECKRNGVRLRIPSWQYRRRVNASAAMIGSNSRTEAFPLLAGDTLSFYRELFWYPLRGGHNEMNNYYARDTLDYSVELVRVRDSSRVALLDSLGVLPSFQPSIPRLYGMCPMAALVKYVVPPELANGDSVFMRLLPYARGDGDYFFTRADEITIGLSRRVDKPFWQALNAYIGQRGAEPKVEIGELQRLDEMPGDAGELEVIPDGDRATITFRAPVDAGRMAVAVFDATGTALFYPYTGPASASQRSISYQFPRSGVYFVGLSHDGMLLRTKKIIITR